MLDERHCEDTLFIVAEADHIFYEADCLSPTEWLSIASTERWSAPEVLESFAQSLSQKSMPDPEKPVREWGADERSPGDSVRRLEGQQSAGHKRAYGA